MNILYQISCLKSLQLFKLLYLLMLSFINKMEQRKQIQGLCKNHSQNQAQYFLTDQPWVTFCQHCALSLALFGKPISKNHTPEQLKDKSKINSWYNKFNDTLKLISENKKAIDEVMSHLELSMFDYISEQIKKVENYIQKLSSMKDTLKKTFSDLIDHKISTYYETQTKITLAQLNLKNQMQQIELNTQSIIEGTENTTKIHIKIQQWEQMVNQTMQLIVSEADLRKLHEQARSICKQVNHQLSQINTIRLERESNMSTIFKQNISTFSQSQTLISKQRKNPRLKLRSQSKTSTKRSSLALTQKSLRDSTNVTIFSNFQY